MTGQRRDAEFPGQADENRRIWDANAAWWDDRIGDAGVSTLLQFGFEAGFVVDGIEEPRFTGIESRPGVRWQDMPDIPPILVVRMRMVRRSEPIVPP